MIGRVGGKVALVTGAARGIGRACAIRLAEEGADVALLDVGRSVETVPYPGSRANQLAEVADEIRAIGQRACEFAVDVRDGVRMRAAADAAVDDLGRIDILVAAAGIDSWAAAWELSEAQWRTMMDVNLTGLWHSCKAVTPQMIHQKSGAMVLIGSVLSRRANRHFAHYAAAKHAGLGLMRSFALELAPFMIRVNSVDPTAVATDMIMNQRYMNEIVGHDNATMEEVEALYLRWNTMPVPWIDPIDVANAVLFLASDEARFVTGVDLLVDLGAMLK